MNNSPLMSEADVKKALGIDSFRNLSKQKVMDFVSMIPYMDKEVAMAIINQFPEYAKMAGEMIIVMKELSNNAFENNNISQAQVAAMYQQVLNSLTEQLKEDDLSFEQKNMITMQMIDTADHMAKKDSENKQFIIEVLRWVGRGALALAFLGVTTYFGVNIKTNIT